MGHSLRKKKSQTGQESFGEGTMGQEICYGNFEILFFRQADDVYQGGLHQEKKHNIDPMLPLPRHKSNIYLL